MGNDRALRARVERLLSGNIVPEDFTRLFLSLRECSFGATSVREIGHFVGHNDKRTRGTVTDLTRDTFVLIRFKIWHLAHPMESDALPSNVATVLKAAFRLVDQQLIKKDTGFKRRKAESIFDRLLKKLHMNSDGTYRLLGINSDELILFRSLTSYIITRTIFDEETLLNDFEHALRKNKLLRTNDNSISVLKVPLALFAVTSMHLCDVELEDASIAHLRGGVDPDGNIHVTATASVSSRLGKTSHIPVAISIFQTSLQANDWCENPIASGWAWAQPIELAPGPRLVTL